MLFEESGILCPVLAVRSLKILSVRGHQSSGEDPRIQSRAAFDLGLAPQAHTLSTGELSTGEIRQVDKARGLQIADY